MSWAFGKNVASLVWSSFCGWCRHFLILAFFSRDPWTRFSDVWVWRKEISDLAAQLLRVGSIYLSIDLSIYRSIDLSIYRSIDLSIYRSIDLAI